MSQNHDEIGDSGSALPFLEDAAPPLAPAPMPVQVIEFWTPGRIGAALVRSLRAVRRLPAAGHAALSAPNSDDAG
jgi:hypothetical protein